MAHQPSNDAHVAQHRQIQPAPNIIDPDYNSSDDSSSDDDDTHGAEPTDLREDETQLTGMAKKLASEVSQ